MTVVSRERLVEVFVEVADTLVDEYDVIEFLQMVTDRTAELIGGADVGLLLSDPAGRLHFMAASNEEIRRLELYQLQQEEGPCLDAYRSGSPVVNAELRDAQGRWPKFAVRAIEVGYHAVHAIPLRLRREVIGAMGAFSLHPGRLEEADVHIVQALADVATIGLLQERAIRRSGMLTEQLQSALNSRVVIEQAKGAIAQARSISVDAAFAILRSHARNNGRPLVEVARTVLIEPARLAELSAPSASPPEPQPGRES